MICAGCCHEHELHSNGRIPTCPICRARQPPPKEYVKMLEKWADANDANAVNLLGMKYLNGDYDSSIKKDTVKALTFLQRAADLGSAPACRSLGVMYEIGHGVIKDEAKSKQYYEKCAMAGDVVARFNLGCIDANAGNFDRAIKHWLIAASFGDIGAVNNIKNEMIKGHATNDQYAQALHQYQVPLDEVKSDQRDKAAAYADEYMYLIEDTR
jgi:TPR repeat protein